MPAVKPALQVAVQLMPAGVDTTEPEPTTPRPSVYVTGGSAVKFADTARAAVMLTTQAALPLHAPDQPANCWPAAGVAVSVTSVPEANRAEQVLPQVMPAGTEVTVPEPTPLLTVTSSG